MMEPILERLPLRAERCHFEPDGTFPHYQPNPLLEENRRFIIGEVKRTGADLGIAWDGDADRCFFIDDTGEFVPGDFITALVAESMLAKHPGETILYDLRASRAVPDIVERAGGTAIASRVGHAFIKHRMRKENAIFAGEVSGHYYFRDFYGVDTGIVPALVVLELVSRSGKQLSELLAPAARALPPLGRDQLDRRATCRSSCRSSRSATARAARAGGSRTSTASRSTSTTGTSTCGPPTPSRCCGSTSRPTRPPRWSAAATRCSP